VRGGATRIASAAARALAVVVAVGGGAPAQQRPVDPKDRFAARPDEPELDAAIQIDRWLEATAVRLDDGWAWPAVPDDWAGRRVPAESLDPSLYSGSAGIVLFGLELARATTPMATDSPPVHDSPFLEMPMQAAKHLVATLPKDRIEGDGEGCGLYTGIAGVGFALFQFGRATLDVDAHRGARRCVELLAASAHVAGVGIEWGECTDVISGGAGIGLFLIHMGEQDHDPLARELAIRAGRRLLDLGEREEVGRSWRMTPTFPRVMPNFSHGTAGVAFFLARLYELTGDVAFLDGALDGARHVFSLADTSNDGCQVFHHSNDADAKDDASGRALHYLGWCHGPVGTAQLFMKLAQVSGDPDWTDRVLQCANSVRDSGVPEHATPGFWNNVSVCCGSAGVASFFEILARARTTPLDPTKRGPDDDPDHAFARRCLDWTLARGTRDEHGLRFPQAEHRVKPELVQAQVGLMQGAAGIGLTLLRIARLSGVATGLPDDPTSTQSGAVSRASLFPACPATEPDAATSAFENLGRGVLFVAQELKAEHLQVRSLHDAPPQSLPLDAWCDAAQGARAKFVMLAARDAAGFGLWDSALDDHDVASVRPGADLVRDFVESAREHGLAVGLSLPFGPDLSLQLSELLTKYGPIALLRIEVPCSAREWPQRTGPQLYRTVKLLAPHTLVEFVTLDRFWGRGRGPDGVQRVGDEPRSNYDSNYDFGRAPRVDRLWPTDVVADFEYGSVQTSGFVGNYLRAEPSPAGDGAWRVVEGRRCYVPLQIELPVGPKDRARRPPESVQPQRAGVPFAPWRIVGDELVLAEARARNILFVVEFEPDGAIDRDTVTLLRELGTR